MKVAPFPIKTPFLIEGKNSSEISFPHVKFLQSLADEVTIAPGIVAIPATATEKGQPGEMAFDANWLYVCVAKDVWRRIALGAF